MLKDLAVGNLVILGGHLFVFAVTPLLFSFVSIALNRTSDSNDCYFRYYGLTFSHVSQSE